MPIHPTLAGAKVRRGIEEAKGLCTKVFCTPEPCSGGLREVLPFGVWNLKKYLEIGAATRAAPAKLGFLKVKKPGFKGVFTLAGTPSASSDLPHLPTAAALCLGEVGRGGRSESVQKTVAHLN